MCEPTSIRIKPSAYLLEKMLFASLLLCTGAVSAVPHGNFFNHYQNPVHNKPISYAYMKDPMSVMYLQPARHSPFVRPVNQEYMLGEQFFKQESKL